jgi:hypothetical protein
MGDDGMGMTTRAGKWKVVRRIIIGAIITFLIFEVGIRFVPADGLSYTAYQDGQLVYTYSTSDQSVITSWQNALNSNQAPAVAVNCSHGLDPNPIYRTWMFTWHSIPVETATNNPTECGYGLSSGGLPNVFTLSVPHQYPPVEPPNSH